ncbi:MAG: trypsin-like peptidase domain-containing protein [Gemmatimonadaceae bacterium]|nr:trypsin-like peptidase domain-containing protein [Gemmatimonadaceae bacterium]
MTVSRRGSVAVRAVLLLVAAAIVAIGVGARAWQRRAAARAREQVARRIGSDSAAATLQRAIAAMQSRDTVFAAALSKRVLPAGSATLVQARIQRAVTSVPFASIHDRNVDALALVSTEAVGTPLPGTAFGVSPEGRLMTSRHVLQAAAGARVRVRYAGTNVWLPARVLRVSDTADLALIQLDARGRYPAIVGVSHNGMLARVGAPVASIGFAAGADARPTMTAGMVSALGADLLQIQAYAGESSSGSPVFDARGDVVGVVAGSATAGERVLFAVPWGRVTEFLKGP